MRNKIKTYIEFVPGEGYPASKLLFYECGLCGDCIQSKPERSIKCKCSNIIIDTDAGRISIKDKNQFKAFIFK